MEEQILVVSQSQRSRMGVNNNYNDQKMYDDVIENIFSRLSIKKLFQLSSLSTQFRYSWKFCRDLSFDRDFAANLSRNQFIYMVNNIFHFYLGASADKFHLYFNVMRDADILRRWIVRAVRLKIRVFELDLSLSDTVYTLNYDTINVESIKIIKLVKCELHMPIDSNGFKHLTELTFQNVTARPMAIQSIFINCLALKTLRLIGCSFLIDLRIVAHKLKAFENLVVRDCSQVLSININAPTLNALHYHGKMSNFMFESDLFHLSDLILDISHPRSFHIFSRRNAMINSIANVQILTVTSIFLEGLCPRFEGNGYKEMETFLWKLKEFHLIVSPESLINPCDVIIFLKKCPHIERVFIDLGKNSFRRNFQWILHGKTYLSECDKIFSFLKCIKVKGFTMTELPVAMTRFFLKNAIHLQYLVLVKAKQFVFVESLTPLHICVGLQPNAKIEIYEHNRDLSIIWPTH